MASTYTDSTGIEKPGSGEQAGTWGTTTNNNFDIIDTALHGQVEVTISGDTDLTTSDGATSNGANPVIVLTGSHSSTFELRVDSTADKHYNIKNETSAACRVIYKGQSYTTSNGVEILAGASAAVTGAHPNFKSLTQTTEVVKDTSPQLGGNLDVNAKNIVFGDSSGASDDRLAFGASTDLEIYHDATDSIIDNSTGALKILGDDIQVKNGANNETSAKFIADGAVELYHNNVKKIETTADGVDIVGDISLTGGSGWRIHVDGNNELVFSYGSATVAKIGTNGAITSENDVTAFGTVA
tara:strand:+ start:9342 stop:10235 length:894 start_codon:yes stop_codon:yes gene_type:complete